MLYVVSYSVGLFVLIQSVNVFIFTLTFISIIINIHVNQHIYICLKTLIITFIYLLIC